MELLFWLAFAFLFYTFIGYGIILYVLVRIKQLRASKPVCVPVHEPPVTLIVPAYNEMDCIAQKVQNCLELEYSSEKLRLLFVTEGSTDGTTEYVQQFPQLSVIGGAERRGKVAAMNVAMQQVSTPVVVFTDANTLLNRQAIRLLVQHYHNPEIGAVSGEKRILMNEQEEAAGAGEGIYWKYESLLKRLDAELYSIVGAAGELFSLRTELYQPVEPDTLLDDFVISLRIAGKGYRVAYEPKAIAAERPSASVAEEMKRKIRICAGGFQAMVRLRYLLNPFRYGILTFQYVSHRVFRWTVAPLCLPVLFISNFLLWNASWLYQVVFVLQLAFYGLAAIGYLMEKKRLRIKLFFIPFYFSFMHYSVFPGFVRYLRGNLSGTWEKARRSAETPV